MHPKEKERKQQFTEEKLINRLYSIYNKNKNSYMQVQPGGERQALVVKDRNLENTPCESVEVHIGHSCFRCKSYLNGATPFSYSGQVLLSIKFFDNSVSSHTLDWSPWYHTSMILTFFLYIKITNCHYVCFYFIIIFHYIY